MNKGLKVFLVTFSVIIIIFGLVVYVSFFGFPWKKYAVANQTVNYLEEKYEEEFIIKKRYFNFKDGKYGIVAAPKKDPNIQFHAGEGYGEFKYVDDYVDVIWVKELEAELKNEIERIITDYESVSFTGVYGMANELKIQKGEKTFKEVDSLFTIHIRLTEYWSKERQEQSIKELLEVVKLLQHQKINNTEIYLNYKEREDSKEFHYIHIPIEKISTIQTVEDIKNLIN